MNNTIELPSVTITNLTTALVKSMETRKGYKDPASFAPSVRRPGVGVFNIADKQPVDTIDGLLELLSAVDETSLKIEEGYHGVDHATTTVVRVPLPQGYVARVPRLKLRHVPESYFPEVEPVWLDARPGRSAAVKLLCGSLDPVWADKALMEVPKEVIAQYNVLTIKLDNESGTVKSWFPGPDTQSDLCASLGDQFVLVGPFYNDKGNIQYRQKKR
jgi:hypothetical protein